jgi:hypothetical protein
MPVERKGQAIAIWLGSTGVGSNRHQEEPDVQWKAAAFVRWHEPDDARVSRDERDVIDCVSRAEGRPLTQQEIDLSLAQARSIGQI